MRNREIVRHNPVAQKLADSRFARRVVRNKKSYSRKGKAASSRRNIEDSIRFAKSFASRLNRGDVHDHSQ